MVTYFLGYKTHKRFKRTLFIRTKIQCSNFKVFWFEIFDTFLEGCILLKWLTCILNSEFVVVRDQYYLLLLAHVLAIKKKKKKEKKKRKKRSGGWVGVGDIVLSCFR